jgi:AraC-like DNA-binding protein
VKRPVWTLTGIEQEIITQLRSLRATSANASSQNLLDDPARLVHHLLLSRHGNVQLRLAPIAREIGIEMRTLERIFAMAYGRTMAAFQQECRLNYACRMLKAWPPTKVGALALFLGYTHLQDFNRFFKRHMSLSPSVWGRRERERSALPPHKQGT